MVFFLVHGGGLCGSGDAPCAKVIGLLRFSVRACMKLTPSRQRLIGRAFSPLFGMVHSRPPHLGQTRSSSVNARLLPAMAWPPSLIPVDRRVAVKNSALPSPS